MSPKRRVILVSDASHFAGAERYLRDLALGHDRERFELEFALSWEGGLDDFAGELSQAGHRVRRLPPIPTLKGHQKALLKVGKHFLSRRAQVLHFNLSDPRACNGYMVAATLAGHGRFVATEHLPSSPFDQGPLPLRHRMAARRTRTTIVNTDRARDIVLARPINRSRVVVIPNGIADSGEPTPERRAAARREMGLADFAGPLVGMVGRLVDQKNPDLFLEAVRRVLPTSKDVRFVVVGDGPLFSVLEEKARELEMGERLLFLGYRDDAAELIFGLDLLVNTSLYEGMPYALMEAMIAGVPILATRIFGSEELVVEGVNGRLVPGEDGDVLGEALLELLSDREALATLGRVARVRALTLFSRDGMCRRTEEVWDGV